MGFPLDRGSIEDGIPDTPEQTERRLKLIAMAQAGKYKSVRETLWPLFVHPARHDNVALKRAVFKMMDDTGPETFIRQQKAISIFDLGCGPGNGTELLAAAFPRATIVGLDLSDNMLAVARARVAAAQFIKQDIETWRPANKADLIFANAALQFVPYGAACLVAPRGRLARGADAKQYSRTISCFNADGSGR